MPGFLMWTGVAAAAGLALFGLDRTFLWMESRGWIYWRRRQGKHAGIGNAVLQLHALLEPSKRYVIQVKETVRKEEAEPGDPPRPGPTGRMPR